MAKEAVKDRGIPIRVGCAAFGISEACYRYSPRLSSENEEIADHLLRLTPKDGLNKPTQGGEI